MEMGTIPAEILPSFLVVVPAVSSHRIRIDLELSKGSVAVGERWTRSCHEKTCHEGGCY